MCIIVISYARRDREKNTYEENSSFNIDFNSLESKCSKRFDYPIFIRYRNRKFNISIYKKSKKQDSIAFYFEKLKNDRIKIHFTQKSLRTADSNRKLFINDKFYSIIFDTDYQFYVKAENDFPIMTKFKDDREREFKIVKMPDIEERLKNKSLYVKDGIRSIIDWSTFWVVDQNGKLIETNSK